MRITSQRSRAGSRGRGGTGILPCYLSDLGVYAPGSQAQPGLRVETTVNALNGIISKRLCDASEALHGSTNLRHQYGKMVAISADGTYFAIQEAGFTQIRRVSNGGLVGAEVGASTTDSDMFFHPTDDDLAYYRIGNLVKRRHVSAATEDTLVTGKDPSNTNYFFMSTFGEGQIDYNFQYMAFRAYRKDVVRSVTLAASGSLVTVTQTAHPWLSGESVEITNASNAAFTNNNSEGAVYTITKTGANTYTYTTSGSPPATGTAEAQCQDLVVYGLDGSLIARQEFITIGGNLDWCGMSPSGNYVLTQTAAGDGSHFTKALNRADLSFVRNLHPTYSHSGAVKGENGNDLFAYDAQAGVQIVELTPQDQGIAVIDIVTGVKRLALQGSYHFSAHVSGQVSYSHPGWVTISTTDGPTNPSSNPFYREVFLLKVDDPGFGSVKRLLHTHSPRVDYFDEPHAGMSWNGRWGFFSSCWDNPGASTPKYLYMFYPPSGRDIWV